MTVMMPASVDPLRCGDVAESLSELIDGELDPRRALRVEVHLATCPTCARLARELCATVAALHAIRLGTRDSSGVG